jgi:hypothetical protein
MRSALIGLVVWCAAAPVWAQGSPGEPPTAGTATPEASPAPPPSAAPPPYPYPYPYPYAYPYPPPYAAPPPPPQPPARLPYTDGQPVPQGYHVGTRVRRGPIIAGAIMAGTTYGINLLIASFAEESNEDATKVTLLYVPGVGTWGYVDEACSGTNDGCEYVILHSATHTIGVALVIYGLVAQKKELVRNDLAVTVLPFVGRNNGLGLVGKF